MNRGKTMISTDECIKSAPAGQVAPHEFFVEDARHSMMAANRREMTPRNRFTKAQALMFRKVGSEIKDARVALRLGAREAAEMTVVPRRKGGDGHISEFTWRRAEAGFNQQGGYEIPHRSEAMTYMAIAEVVGLDGAAICKRVGLVPPPQRKVVARPRGTDDEVAELRTLAKELVDRLERLERGVAR